VQILMDDLKKNPPTEYPVPPYPNYHQDDGLGSH
jgi:tricorn protease